MKVTLVHDYLTQRGGAERVVLSLARAFPDAPIYTSLYDPSSTFPEFAKLDVRPLALNSVPVLRRRHRLAFPFLAPAFGRLEIDADVAICSSSGWAHGVRTTGRKLVYCHTPARWLYQSDRYLREGGPAVRVVLAALKRPLILWDRSVAVAADRYVANSGAVRDRIQDAYGIEATVVPPPQTLDASADQDPVDGVEPGYVLCVSRFLPYKNVDAVVAAFADLPDERLVVVGRGPDEARLRRLASTNVAFVGAVTDAQMRWLYANGAGLVAASHEDFGLTPVEAASFGKPAAVLEFGGFLDTVTDATGVFFSRPDVGDIRRAVEELGRRPWDADGIREHAARYSEESFAARLREIVDDMISDSPSRLPTATIASDRRQTTSARIVSALAKPEVRTRLAHVPGTAGIWRHLRDRPYTVPGGAAAGLVLVPGGASIETVGGSYEADVADALVRLLHPGDTFFDIGAAVGFYALVAARAVGRTGSVFAFEPEAANAEVLRRNVRLNRAENVLVAEAAVSSVDGQVPFVSRSAFRGRVRGAEQAIAVKAVRLDSYVEQTGANPDLLKIDVEGHEVEVLRGMAGVLEQRRPTLVIELHSTHEQVTELLRRYGYQIEAFAGSDPSDWNTHVVARPVPQGPSS